MDTRQTFILGALVTLAGVIVGAGTAITAQVTNGGAANPNAAKDIMIVPMDAVDLADYAAQRPQAYPDTPSYQRIREFYGAAPELDEFDLSHCEGLSGSRLSTCIATYLEDGTIYIPGQIRGARLE